MSYCKEGSIASPTVNGDIRKQEREKLVAREGVSSARKPSFLWRKKLRWGCLDQNLQPDWEMQPTSTRVRPLQDPE